LSFIGFEIPLETGNGYKKGSLEVDTKIKI
jgi:hypothetical protein